MNYALGYLAGVCDRRGWLLARDVLYALPFFRAARIDGFDAGVEP